MTVQKNFVVKNGIEVNTNLIFADTGSNKVGITTTNPRHTLHVNGGIGATSLNVTGISTINNLSINGKITAGSTAGVSGQYLVSTGTGVTWGSVPTVRSSDLQTAGVGATTFNTTYTVGLLDVYINGVKLSSDEYTANNSATVILDDACFGGETIEFISYSPFGIGVGGTSIQGITILEEGSPVGGPLQVTSINFVGAAVTGSGVGVTVYTTTNPDYWVSTTAGIHTLSNVGVGTTNPTNSLTVKGNTSLETLKISGVSTFSDTIVVGTGKSITFGEAGANFLKLYSDGSNTYINQSNMGKLIIDASGTQRTLEITDSQASKTMAKFIGNGGAVELYYDGNKKIETISTGVTVTGTTFTNQLSVSGVSTFTGRIVGPVRFSKDGSLTATQNVEINADGSYAFLNVGGSSLLYFDLPNTIIRNTYSGGRIRMDSPSGIDFEQYGLGGEYRARFDDSSVSLYSSNSKKFETIGAGVTVTGTTFTNQLNVSGVSTFNDNVRVVGIVTSSKVLISNDGGNNGSLLIEDTGTYSQLTFRASNGTDQASIQGVEGNLYITPGSNGYVSLPGASTNIFYSNGNVSFNNGLQGTTTFSNGFAVTNGNVGIGTTNATDKLTVRGGDISVGVSTSQGVILTSPNGTRYRLIVADGGTLSTVSV
jgi:hypothetical protein